MVAGWPRSTRRARWVSRFPSIALQTSGGARCAEIGALIGPLGRPYQSLLIRGVTHLNRY